MDIIVNTEKRVVRTLTIAVRLKIIEQIEVFGRKVKDVAKEYDLPQSTVSTIYKNKENWKVKAENAGNLHKKRMRLVGNDKLEVAMELFVRQARENNIPLSGSIIRAKACEFADKLGLANFKGSAGWLSKFCKRQRMSFRKLCGESASVDLNMTSDWMSNVLPGLINEYEPNDIFNADETGLFFKCLPEKSFVFRSETCHGGKYSKQRLTVMCATNMNGTEKLPLLVIGKSPSDQNPSRRCITIPEQTINVDKASFCLFDDGCMDHNNRYDRQADYPQLTRWLGIAVSRTVRSPYQQLNAPPSPL
ncbi:tigger transposable element-derived protein 4-like [Armigeres subalbatus]|uniref:tigger transposable element-derived protein 4-like n=1 Tax=Armigeres subalbatus TaxID=124917 RepID=UPI002ED4E245